MSKPQYDIDEAWVQRYREGKLSEEEQHWLEENPFEAEALAGLSENPQWRQDVANLQQQLQERSERRTTLWAVYGRYAAAIAILITVGWLVYQIVPNGNLTEPETKSALSYEAQDDSVTDEVFDSSALLIPEKITIGKPKPMAGNIDIQIPNREVRRVPLPEQQSLALLEPAAAPALPEAIADEVVEEEIAETLQGKAEGISAEPPVAQYTRSRTQSARFTVPTEQFSHKLVGRVYDANDRSPVSGANVQVKGTIVGTITDINGQFKVTVPESNDKLIVSSVGYQPEEITVNQQDSLTIRLEADLQALSEVVVVGYGKKKKTDNSQPAYPLPSHKEFREYLKTNLRYPTDAQIQGVGGTVKVRFTVTANGQLTNFEVKQSLGYGCDTEAIRLIKEGPTWQPTLQNGQWQDEEVMVKVRFKLPTK
ncbi:MAG: TonB family protein [Bacteroidota bacterium]